MLAPSLRCAAKYKSFDLKHAHELVKYTQRQYNNIHIHVYTNVMFIIPFNVLKCVSSFCWVRAIRRRAPPQ